MEEYWTVSTGVAVRHGWSCRDCKGPITKGEVCYVRDGRKLRLFYHERCFSGTADPRTQTHSSFQRWRNTIADQAPAWKGRGKWSVSSYGYEGSKLLPISSTWKAVKSGTNKPAEGSIRPEVGDKPAPEASAERHDAQQESLKGEVESIHAVALASSRGGRRAVEPQGPACV